MMNMTTLEFGALLRSDLYSFTERSFYELCPQTIFLGNWHIEVIVSKLELCRTGKIKRLIINLPPRNLKSICASVAFPAYLLGKDPSAQIMCVSYAQDLSDKHARDCRTIMNSAWYQRAFRTRLSGERQSVQEFTTTDQGYRMATSVGGVLTGRGADFIIIDDPLKPEEALSEAVRKTTNEWFSHTLYSRLNSKSEGCIIIIMQRLHEDDLVGHVLQQEGWEVLSFPAIAEAEEETIIETVFGTRTHRRKPGDILHPERESEEELERLRKMLGEYHFSGQYQQAPAPRGGGLVKENWFQRYNLLERPEAFEMILQSWDTANKSSELNDYSVCTTWGIKDKRIYLLNVLRKRLDYPSLKRAVQEQAQIYNPTTILIEDKQSGTQLLQELKEAGVYAATAYQSKFDKVLRLGAQTGVIENGFVYIPQDAHWLGEYLHELTTFPNGKFDDQVDSTSQALEWLKQRTPGWGILQYYADLVASAGRSQVGPMVRYRIQPGVSHVYTITGRQVLVGDDNIIELTPDEAEYVQPGWEKL